MSRLKDETGHIYGNLTVLSRAENNSKGQAMWNCLCSCGKVKIYSGSTLRRGQATSCGNCDIKRQRCAKIGKSNFIDLTGQRFGKLVVLEQTQKPDYVNRQTIYWKCKCDCGNYHIAEGTNLRRGNVLSCGCLKSKGEEKISSILNSFQINYRPQYTEDRFKLSTGYLPHYDFAIFDKDDNLLCLLEYHGEQHYKYYSNKNTWNNKENFLKTQRRDEEKKEICEKLKIKLYVISYKDFDKLEKIIYNIIKEINR